MKQSGWSKVKGFFKQDAFLKWSRNQLRSYYNSTMSQVMITPWNPDDTVHIDEVYVKLSFLRDERKSDGTTKVELKDYSEIFQSHGNHLSPKRIVVYGRPGIGKSTFSKKLAVDWSRSKKILKKFDVLLLVKLRDVCDTQDLRSMLEKAELLSADDPTVFDRLYSFIIENQQKVLFVLDGYDEYNGEKSSPVHQIWRGTQLRDCSVLMTSRPTKEEELVTPSHAQFEISGFSDEEVTRFAFKIFKNREDVSRFIDFLSERSLWDMAEIPLLLLMLCLTWKEKGLEELAASRANIYDSFLETLFNHMAAKHRGKTLASSDDYKEDLAKLGEFAFDALLVDCLYLKLDIFPEDIRALIEKLIEVGFFQISKLSRSVRPVQVLFFLHKSIQEFLSARAIIRELKNAEKGDFTCLSKIDSLEKIKKLIEVLKFVCELSSEAASIVLSHLRSVGEKEGLIECGFSDTPSVKELSKNQREFRIISLDCMLSCPVSQRQDVYSQFLQCVSSVVVIDCDRQLPVVAREHLLMVSQRVVLPDYLFFTSRYCDAAHDDVLSIMGDLETVFVTPNGATTVDAGHCSGLDVNDFYLKAEGQQMVLCLTHIVKFFDEPMQPVELLRALTSTQESPPQKPVDHASQNQDISSGPCPTENENTSGLVHTHSLSFVREIRISWPTSEMLMVINTLFSSVLNKPQVVRISCIPETCSAQLIETLVSCIPFTNNLYKLKLADINLTAKSAAVIAKSLLQVPHLKKLELRGIDLHDSVDYLVENLHHLLQLTDLRLSDVHGMGAGECQSVAAALKHLPCLKVLDLPFNPLGQGISELAKQFIHVPHLTDLNLTRTQMGEEEVTVVARSLQNISNLELLDLSFNPLHQGITKLAKHFIHVPYLTRLELTNTQMGEEEVTAVAHALKDVPELEYLDLSNNPLGRGVGELTKHLSSITKLKSLYLWSVKMTKKEASDLCTAAQGKDFEIWSDYHEIDFLGGSRVTRLRTKSERALDFIRSKF